MYKKIMMALLCLTVGICAGCYFLVAVAFHPPGPIIRQQTSPGGKFTALVEEHKGLAHLDDGRADYDIWIRNNYFLGSKAKVANFWGAYQADGSEGVGLKWNTPESLSLLYCDATNSPRSTTVVCGYSLVKVQVCKQQSHRPAF